MPHVNVKLFALPGPAVAAEAIPVFHRWIQARDLPELLIDVADYSHVPAGPGVLLIGHEASYSLDCRENRLGLLYSRKAPEGGLRQAYDAARTAAQRLESEPEFRGRLQFDGHEIEVTWNDRLLHPNTETGWLAVEPDVMSFFDGLFGEGKWTCERAGGARERLRITVRG